MSETLQSGIVTIAGTHSVEEMVARLVHTLTTKDVKIFVIVDHSGEAQKAGLHMPDTKLLIFGNGRAGTPLMLASSSIALDLPLKLLVWEDADGKTWITYNSPEYLAGRHHLPAEFVNTLKTVTAIADDISK